jgi:hypothetical protein
MDVLEWFRGIERMLIVSASILSLVLGALLFKWGIFVPSNFSIGTEGGEKVGKFKLTFDNAAPGTLFALFAAFVLCVSLFSPATREQSSTKDVSSPSATEPGIIPSGNESTHKSWRYADPQKITEFLDQILTLKTVNATDLQNLQTTAKSLKLQLEKKPK